MAPTFLFCLAFTAGILTTPTSADSESSAAAPPIMLQCVRNDNCVFAATSPPDRFQKLAKERWLGTIRFDSDPCDGQERRSDCCRSALRDPDFIRTFNEQLTDESEELSHYCTLLCSEGRDRTCYLSCDLSSLLFMCSKSTAPPKTTTESEDDDDDDEETSTNGSSASLTDDDDDGPDVTLIVVSCLVAFLAGIGGAILITWCLRRQRPAKDGGEENASSSGTIVRPGEQTVYEELPEAALERKNNNQNRPNRTSSQNEYTYIPDHVIPYRSTSSSSSTPTSSSYNVPGDHLAHRKLPSAPGQRLDENGSRDGQNSNGGNNNTTPAGRNSRPYFELERESSLAVRGEKPTLPDRPYFVLEKGEGDATSGADYFSPLKRDEGEEEEYCALDQKQGEATYTREYLELVEDYSLQKPVD